MGSQSEIVQLSFNEERGKIFWSLERLPSDPEWWKMLVSCEFMTP